MEKELKMLVVFDLFIFNRFKYTWLVLLAFFRSEAFSFCELLNEEIFGDIEKTNLWICFAQFAGGFWLESSIPKRG